MTDTIKAALTAEEWAHPIRIQAREYDSDRNAAAEIVRDGDAIHITEHEHRRYGVIDTPEQKHALAALCLHGQPFGFLKFDPTDLEYAANVVERMSASSEQPEFDTLNMNVAKSLRLMAAKIAALLP